MNSSVGKRASTLTNMKSLLSLSKYWFLALVLILALLFSLNDKSWYDSIGLLWVVFALSISLIWAEFKIWAGSKWICYPLSLISFIAFLHILTGREGEDWIGLFLMPMFYGFYLLARYLGEKLSITIAIASIGISIQAIVIRLNDWNTVHLGVGITHTISFVILVGIIVSPAKWKIPVIAVGIPAIILSRSEEGMILLVTLLGIYLWKRYWNHKLLLILPSLVLVAVIVVPNLDRFESLDRMTTHRQVAYVDYFQNGNLLYGEGWNWDTTKQTIHNAPLKLASQYGLVAGVSWLGIFFWALWRHRRTKYFYAFLLVLGAGMLDHYLWTYMAIWPFIILGLAEVKHDSS